ncbi:MAG TPA: hypothetical protein VEV61_11120 [Streptosporangiaceae bacterium]|nr:hypothetical protein [Streptosporangiaceae bacterium]
MSNAWEYLVTANAHDPETLTHHVNNHARVGWELITVTFAVKGESGTHYFYWRRPVNVRVPEPPPGT